MGMDDRDFMDMMYQGFTKTTHAEDAYWAIITDEVENQNDVFAVDQDGNRYLVAADLEMEDAAFITAVHGAFPDIHRRWLQALDEAEQKDIEKDQAESVAADLSERLGAYEAKYGVEDWHGKAAGS